MMTKKYVSKTITVIRKIDARVVWNILDGVNKPIYTYIKRAAFVGYALFHVVHHFVPVGKPRIRNVHLLILFYSGILCA